MKGVLPAILSAAALVAAGWSFKSAWRSLGQQRLAAAECTAIAQRRVIAEEALRRAEARVDAASAMRARSLAGANANVGANRMTQPATVQASPPSHSSIAHDISRLMEKTRTDPAVQRAEDEGYDVELHWIYEGLFQRLGLSQEQSRTFVEILKRRSAEHRDLVVAARALGVSVYDPAVIQLNERSEQEYFASQRGLLGDDGVKELKRYDASLKARHIATAFAGMATLENMPLSVPQVEQIVAIIDRATQDPPRGLFPQRMNIDWSRVDKEVSGVLTESQAALFKSAEAPGVGRGGSRFVTMMNQTVIAANHADLTSGTVRPEPEPQ